MKLTNIGASSVVAAAIGIAFTVSPRALIAQSGPVILTSPAETPGQFSYGFADPEAQATVSGSRLISIAILTAPKFSASTC